MLAASIVRPGDPAGPHTAMICPAPDPSGPSAAAPPERPGAGPASGNAGAVSPPGPLVRTGQSCHRPRDAAGEGCGVDPGDFGVHADPLQPGPFLRAVGQGQDGHPDGGQPVDQRRRQLLAALRHDGGPGQAALARRQQFRQFAAPPDDGDRPVKPLQPADQVFARIPDSDDRDAHRPVPPGFQTTEIFALLACAPSRLGICPSVTSTITTVDREDPSAVLPGVICAISAPGSSRVG